MRKFFTVFVLAISLFLSLAPVYTVHADPGPENDTPSGCVLYSPADLNNKDTAPLVYGVLIKYNVKSGGFTCYVYHLLNENVVYIIIVAMVIVVFSGVQYMLAVGSADQQTKAKQRILGVLGGVVFYFLIATISKLLADNLK